MMAAVSITELWKLPNHVSVICDPLRPGSIDKYRYTSITSIKYLPHDPSVHLSNPCFIAEDVVLS